MNRKGWKGSVTVFFSLTCILFLCLICSVVESARVQGARAQTANSTGIGTFSLLGEFEQKLLEEYDIFALDGSYGNGSFKKTAVSQRLEEFVSCNANPKEGILTSWCFDPWNLELTDCSVSGYALLTDESGEPFYQQAVAYMKTNLGSAAISKLLDYVQDAEELEEKQKDYQNNKTKNDNEMSGLEAQKQQRLEQLESEAEAAAQGNGTIQDNGTAQGSGTIQESGTAQGSGTIQDNGTAQGSETTAVVPVQTPENPLKEIAKLRKKSILEIVTWDKAISEKQIKKSGLPSNGGLQKGTFKIEKEYSGLTANVLFREYLLEYFPNYLDTGNEKSLDYQVEYLLGGKTSDKENLKYVVLRLLLLREGMNYLYCISDVQKSSQAESLAVALTGFLGIPALTSATKHALLLAWSYAESLIDIRILLDGGKVPVRKDAATWSLALENLGKITEILAQGAPDKGRGLEYRDYLRLMLYAGTLSKQKLRALDLIQMNLQKEDETKNFKAENCIVAVKTTTEWNCRPVFIRLPQIIMGVGVKDIAIAQKSSMAY